MDCKIEDHYECVHTNVSASICAAILLDLNVFDNTSLGYTTEYFYLDLPVFLSDPNLTNMTEFFISPAGVRI